MIAIRQWSHRVGCATLVDDGLRMLAPIHHILYLESPDTFAIVHALARGTLSFTSPPQEERSQFGVTQRLAASPAARLKPYKTPAASTHAKEENKCSDVLYDRLRAGRRPHVHVKPLPPLPPPLPAPSQPPRAGSCSRGRPAGEHKAACAGGR